MVTDPLVFGDIIVIGGGCYGSFYTAQLLRARARGAATWDRLIVVDRDPECRVAREHARRGALEVRLHEWNTFFDEYLGSAVPAGPPAAIVPSPLMPHLMFEWLVRAARRRWPGREVRPEPAAAPLGTPYDACHADGTRYVSFADWLCPVHCIEPSTCPVIRGPRTWEMSDAVAEWTGGLAADRSVAGPVMFVCRHRTYGVGMFDVADALAADAVVAAAGVAGTSVVVVVGTVSACHGAVSLLYLGPVAGGGARSQAPYISA
jgi:hypothetical protein